MTQISKEYAVALFELAKEQSCAKEFSDALKLIRGEFDAQPEYIELLSRYHRCGFIEIFGKGLQ